RPVPVAQVDQRVAGLAPQELQRLATVELLLGGLAPDLLGHSARGVTERELYQALHFSAGPDAWVEQQPAQARILGLHGLRQALEHPDVGLLADRAQQGLAALHVRRVGWQHGQDVVEPAGADERGVQSVRAVRRRQHYYLAPAGVGREPLHHRAQQPGPNTAVAAGAAPLGEREIQLIGKHDAGRHGLDRLEQALRVTLRVADDSPEQLGEVHVHEVQPAVGGQQLTKPRLPRSGRPGQDEAAGTAAAVADQHGFDHEVLGELLEQIVTAQQTPYLGTALLLAL